MSNIYFLHTVQSAFDYFHLKYGQIHNNILRPDLLSLAQNNSESVIKNELLKIITKIQNDIGDNNFLIIVTCTSLGRYVDYLKKDYYPIERIESYTCKKVINSNKPVFITFSNPIVFEQIMDYIKKTASKVKYYKPLYIPHAFNVLQEGKIDEHDIIVYKFLEEYRTQDCILYLTQVSLCSIENRGYKLDHFENIIKITDVEDF